MQVNEKALLDSAQNILKNRRRESKAQESNFTRKQDAQRADSSYRQKKLNSSRMLKLESELKMIQESYTREQARESFLLTKPEQISGKLKYKGSPLFPEYKSGMDTQSLAKNVGHKLKQLLGELKSLQVEIENLYALNFEKFNPQKTKIREMGASPAVKELDPKRVEQLTRS